MMLVVQIAEERWCTACVCWIWQQRCTCNSCNCVQCLGIVWKEYSADWRSS